MSSKVDPALLKKIAADDVLFEKFMAAAAEAGYDYGVEELSDDELEKAAGGITFLSPTSTIDIKFDYLQTLAVKVEDTALLDLASQVFPKLDY